MSIKNEPEGDRIVGPDDRRYFYTMLNLSDDSDLTVYEYRLLGHYCRVGDCWETVRTTADRTGMSPASVTRARRGLETKGWVEVIPHHDHGDSLLVKVLDRWADNIERYQDEKRPIRKAARRSSGARRSYPDDSVNPALWHILRGVVDPGATDAAVEEAVQTLQHMGVGNGFILEAFSREKAGWWWTEDWRGRDQDCPPWPVQVVQSIEPAARFYKNGGNSISVGYR